MIEVLIALAIAGILSSAAYHAYTETIRRAHKADISTQLSAAAKNIYQKLSEDSFLGEEDCITASGLKDSQKFSISCEERLDQSQIFDIRMTPRNENIKAGGVLTFGMGREKTCWKACNATGAGSTAKLDISSLSLEADCASLKKKTTTYDCNCTNAYVQTGTKAIMNCTTWITCRRVGTAPVYSWVKTCDSCTTNEYVNEDGIALDAPL